MIDVRFIQLFYQQNLFSGNFACCGHLVVTFQRAVPIEYRLEKTADWKVAARRPQFLYATTTTATAPGKGAGVDVEANKLRESTNKPNIRQIIRQAHNKSTHTEGKHNKEQQTYGSATSLHSKVDP